MNIQKPALLLKACLGLSDQHHLRSFHLSLQRLGYLQHTLELQQQILLLVLEVEDDNKLNKLVCFFASKLSLVHSVAFEAAADIKNHMAN